MQILKKYNICIEDASRSESAKPGRTDILNQILLFLHETDTIKMAILSKNINRIVKENIKLVITESDINIIN